MAAAALEDALRRMALALEDADARLRVAMGGHEETVEARVWRGQVLVDWERDDEAGGCLLRPGLVERLAALGASATRAGSSLDIRASPRVLASLSAGHAALAARLGQPAALRLRLRFDGPGGGYTGGREQYVVEPGRRPAVPLVTLRVALRLRASAGTSPASG